MNSIPIIILEEFETLIKDINILNAQYYNDDLTEEKAIKYIDQIQEDINKIKIAINKDFIKRCFKIITDKE